MQDKEYLERINSRSPFNVYNGIIVKEVGDGYALIEGEIGPNSTNPWGTAHGGFIYSLCDVAAGIAAANPKRRPCLTLSGSLYYLRPSEGTYLRAEGRVIKDGRTISLVETNVYSDKGILTARGEFQVYFPEEK